MDQRFAVIVQNDDYTCGIFDAALQAAGFRTEMIPSGSEALKRLAEAVPDLVVLDLCQSHTQGEEALEAIRSDPLLARTCVVVATADPEALEGLPAEADLVLKKPLDLRRTSAAMKGLPVPRYR